MIYNTICDITNEPIYIKNIIQQDKQWSPAGGMFLECFFWGGGIYMQPNPCFQPLEILFSWESHERFPGKGNLSWGFPFSCESWGKGNPQVLLVKSIQMQNCVNSWSFDFFSWKALSITLNDAMRLGPRGKKIFFRVTPHLGKILTIQGRITPRIMLHDMTSSISLR